jgi:predicted lipoprotein with Yx(FWY)xxD motif
MLPKRKGNMRRSRLITSLTGATLIPLSTLAVAACGGAATASRPASASTPTAKTSSVASATVGVANSGLGSILVDSQGRTLYLWQADTGPKSTCSGACAAAWPPLLTTGAPTAGGGAKASLLGTTKRSDGAEQVTYKQHPLYLFTGDTASGQTTGQGSTGFGAPWYVLSPSGNQITGSASTSRHMSGSSSSSGY